LDEFVLVVGVNACLANLLGSSGKRIAPGNVRCRVVLTVNVVVVQNHALVAGRLGVGRRGSLGASRGLAVGLRGVVGGGSRLGLLGSVGRRSLFLSRGGGRGGLRPRGGPRVGPGGLLGGLLNIAGAGGGLGAVLGAVVGRGRGAVAGGLRLRSGLGLGARAGLLLPVAPVLARGRVGRRSGGRRNVTCSDSHVLGGVDDVGLPDDFALHERHGEGAGGESGNDKSGAHVDDWLEIGLLVVVDCGLRGSQILEVFVD
jgi:hypothetical protein